MKRFYFLLAGLALISCSPNISMNQAELKSQIEEVNKKWMAAIEAGNAAGVAACYTENTQLMPPNAPIIKGRDGVKDYMAGTIKAGVKKIKLTTTEVEGDNQRALETGTYQVMVNGNKIIDEGKYIVDWKNVDGKWYFHRDIFNSSMPSPRTTAQRDQNVWVVVYKVKPDKRESFENFVRTKLYPALDRSKPEMDMAARQTRLIVPKDPEKDGSYKYMFVMDPVIEGVDYSIENMLILKHGEKQGKEMMKEFYNAQAGPYEIIIGKQSEI